MGWATFDMRVNGWLVESGLLGRVTVTQSFDDPQESPKLFLTVHSTLPGPVDEARHSEEQPEPPARESLPGEAAVGMSGWTLVWDDVAYRQAPVLSVRAERGDTLAKIAKEMSVDHELLGMANAEYWSGRSPLRPGDLVLVPLLVRAVTPAAKKPHRSVSLSWHEIMHGWTTLN